MQPTDAERLLNAIRSGNINAADIKGEQFQAIIFHKLIEQCGKDRGFEYELVDNYQGAVDFVVREKPLTTSKLHTEDSLHVFECKYYRRTLELSTVAKLLVVGVRFQPTSLNIVSGTSLQPQVYEYARLLFSGLGNDAAMFRRTFFRHYLTNELLDIEIECDDRVEDIITALEGAGKKRIADISWELTELRPFSERIIAASHKRGSLSILDGRWIYRLKISLYTSSDPERLRCWVEGIPSSVQLSPPKTEVSALGQGRYHFRFIQIIDPRQLEKNADINIALNITYASSSHHVFTIPIVATPASREEASYPDLRQEEADEFARSLQLRVAPRLLLLGGEAGIGKTRLCESTAQRLRLTGEFDINRFSADVNSEATLPYTMLTTVCTPAAARAEGGDEWQELATSLLNALSPVPNSDETDKSGIEPVEVLIPVLAELLVHAGPRLIVLRDAHLLTEAAARELGALLTRLDDLGWGDVYCIVEHRIEDGKSNPHWVNLESRLKARINECLQQHLYPLSVGELNEFLDSLFVYITPELKTAIWNICGGVPLYLFSVLDLLKGEGAIKYQGDKRWAIEAPSVFLELARTRRRADGVLEERLKAISWEGTILPPEFEKAPLALISLFAIGHEPARVERLYQLAGIDSEAYRSIRRTLMRHNIIRPSGDEWAFDFQHDLLRRVAIEVSRNSDYAQKVVERVLGRLKEGQPTILDLELCADLAGWMGFHEDAARSLNAAFEIARKSENFSLIRRLLSKLCEELEPGAFSSSKNYTEYLDSRSALAWATWNTGSLIEARAEYSRIVADAASVVDTVVDETVAASYAADAQRRVLGLDLALNDIAAFVQSARRALELDGDSVVFNSIMNRLILYCARFGHVEYGLELAKLTLQVFGDIEPESSGAVICSDIGGLFRAAQPNNALELYHRGVQLATSSRRQRTHNELDALITEVMLGVRQADHEELSAWRRRLLDNGLRSMLARFDTFCGSVALLDGRLEQAQRLYRHVETSVAVYRPGDRRLDMWNDRMIAALVQGDLNETHRLQSLLIDKLADLLEQRRLAFSQLQALMPAIERQKKRFSHLAPLELDLPSNSPPYSGQFIHVLLNLEALAEGPDRLRNSALDNVAELWPTDVDHSAALDVFHKQAASSTVEIDGARLVLCAQ